LTQSEENIEEVEIEEEDVGKINTTFVDNVIKINNNKMKCVACNYDTNIKCNFLRHINSTKHKDKINNDRVCKNCFKIFSTVSNRKRHVNFCKVNYNIKSI
jgi:hypothetical protein